MNFRCSGDGGNNMKSILWIKKTVLTGSILAVVCFASNTSFAKEFYKWVDNKGSTHYTTTPPPKSSQARGKIDTYGYRISSAPTPPVQQNNAVDTNNTQPPSVPNTQTAPSQTVDTQQREANAALEKELSNRSDAQ